MLLLKNLERHGIHFVKLDRRTKPKPLAPINKKHISILVTCKHTQMHMVERKSRKSMREKTNEFLRYSGFPLPQFRLWLLPAMPHDALQAEIAKILQGVAERKERT